MKMLISSHKNLKSRTKYIEGNAKLENSTKMLTVF